MNMNKTGENLYRTSIIQELNKLGHVSRIESHATSIGVPDLNFFSKSGHETWFELKWLGLDNKPEIRSSQVMWHRNRWRVGSNSYFLIGTHDCEHILIPGMAAESLKTLEHDKEHWYAMAYGVWRESPNPPMEDILKRIEAEYL